MSTFSISPMAIERLGWVLVHSLWQFTLIALLAGVAVRMPRKNSAALRYVVLGIAMVITIVVPAVTWSLQQVTAPENPRSHAFVDLKHASTLASSPADVIPQLSPPSDSQPILVTEIFDSGPAIQVVESVVPAETPPGILPTTKEDARFDPSWSERATTLLRPWLAWIVAGWCVGVALFSLRPLLGWRTLRRLRRVGVSPVPDGVLATLRRVSQRLGVRKAVRVLYSTLARVPIVIGYFRPVILLPVSLVTSIPAAQLEAILAHELAHVRRHDSLVNLLQTLVETVFFYHPAVWWVSRRLRAERENCCDDLVVNTLGNRLDYGRALLAIEELRGRSSVLAIGAADGSLLARIRRIVGFSSENDRGAPWSAVSLVVCVIVAVCTIGNEPVLPQGLEFLEPYPKLHGLSLDMTEKQFLAIVKRNGLKPQKMPEGGSNHYWVPADDDHSVIVMFGNNGDKCSGIQRVRADNKQAGLRTVREPAFRLPGHSNVQCVGYDNNGKELVVVSTYFVATVRHWDMVDKKLISEVMLSSDKHLRPFREGTFSLSRDRRRVIAATDDFVGIWDTSTGELLRKLPFPKKEWDYDCVQCLACTPDLSVIAAGLGTTYDRTTLVYDGHGIVWDGVSGKVLQTVTHQHGYNFGSIVLSFDGKRFATLGEHGGGVCIWETSTGRLLHDLPNDPDWKSSDPEVIKHHLVGSVQFSPDGSQLAVGGTLGVELVDTQSGKRLHRIEAPYRYSSGRPSLVFSKDGQMLAHTGTWANDKERTTPVWSTQTGEKLFELRAEADAGAFSDDGKQFAAGVSDRQMALAVFQLSGGVADTVQLPPESTKDKMQAGTHYRGKKAEEFIDNWKPVWGEPQLGMQYGIALTASQRQFRVGERVPLAVFFRNMSDKPQQLDHHPDFLWNAPQVVNANGEAIELAKVAVLGTAPHYRDKLEPGEALGPLYVNFGLGENPRPGRQNWTPYWKTPVTGPYKLTHTIAFQVAGPEASRDETSDDWKPGALTSGQIEFEIVDGGNSAANDQADKPAAAILADGSVSLAEAVPEFNAENKRLGLGLDQPQPTADEVFARRVSLQAKEMPLRLALADLARQAGLELQLDAEALKAVELDVDAPVTARFTDEPLDEALGRLIDWRDHFGAFRQFHAGRLVLTTIKAMQQRVAAKLPDWLRPLYTNGLLADLDEDGQVQSITTSSIATDELLERIVTLPKLRELHIETTKSITPAGLKHLGKLRTLETLSLYEVNQDGNGLGDKAMQAIAGLQSLRELRISNCGLTDAGARHLEGLPQLTRLELDEGRLTDAALASIGKLRHLQHLSLSSYVGTVQYGRMHFTAAGLQSLAGLRELKELHLVGQDVTADLLTWPTLEQLSLGGWTVDDACAERIAACHELKSLSLVYTAVSDEGIRQIATLPALRRLNLDSRVITDAAMEHLKAVKSLEILTLRTTQLTDESLRHAAEMKSLRRLDLHGSGQPGSVTGENFSINAMRQLRALPKLRTLWLTNFRSPGGYLDLKELTQLRELSLMMADIRTEDLEALEEALPNTMIHCASGGGFRRPLTKRRREASPNQPAESDENGNE